MRTTSFVLTLMISLIATTGFGQTAAQYYWYQGQQMPLTIHQDKQYLIYNIADTSSLKDSIGLPNAIISKFGTSQTNQNSSNDWAIINSPNVSQLNLGTMNGILYSAPIFVTPAGKEISISSWLYVKLNDLNDFGLLQQTADQIDVEIISQSGALPLWYILDAGSSSTGNSLETANYFFQTGLFAATQPDWLFNIEFGSCPTDPLFSNQWGWNNSGNSMCGNPGFGDCVDIKGCQATDITTGSDDVIIAVIDEGIDTNHPEFINISPLSYDAQFNWGSFPVAEIYPTQTIEDRYNHGTPVAGIIGADRDNSGGIAGLASGCQLMNVSIDVSVTSGVEHRVINAITWAWQNGADVINGSWSLGTSDQMILDAIQEGLQNGRNGLGTVFVFISQNDDQLAIPFPAGGLTDPDIIVVGAISPCGERKSSTSCDGETDWGSNWGLPLDVMAPGVLIPTTDLSGIDGENNGDYILSWGGTSAAAPHVAAVAGLMLSVNPCLTQKEVGNIIMMTAQEVGGYNYQQGNRDAMYNANNDPWHPEVGHGLLNAHEAVIEAQNRYICSSTCDVFDINEDYVAGQTSNPEIWNPATIGDAEYNIRGRVTVPAGKTLIVEGGLHVRFADTEHSIFYDDFGDPYTIESYLKIEPGGKLILRDDAVLTSYCVNEMWAGILLEGNRNAPQTNATQGVLEIINGGTIEHARNAISVYGRDANGDIDWNTTGGIVRASGANFYNNWRVAEFLSYERTGPTGNPLNNVSHFRNCTFQTTGVLRDGTSPLAFITMLDVRNVSIAGNTFRSDLTASDPIIKRGSGIVSIDASYNVTGYCTAPIQFGQPCPTADLIPNRFINLDAGIVTYHGSDVADIGVKDAEFTGCSYGVKVEGADFVEVVRSTFNIPSGSSQFPYSFSNFGVYSRTGDGLKVEQNTFQSSGVHGSGDGRNVGVGAYNHHQTSANVYRNTFNGLETQTQSALDNSKLQVDCNQFTNSSQTIASLHHATGNIANQGTCLPNPKFPQANAFSGACDGVNVWQIYRNPGAGVFEYNSYDQTTTGWDLIGCTESNVAAVSQNCGPGNISNACPSTINQGIPVLRNTYNGLVSRITDNGQLIDGGDTQGVLNYLAGSSNPGQIKSYLLARSPYLSDKVLLAAIAKNLPPGIIKQILLANSTLSPQVWQAVENAGYPNGIFNALQAAQTGEGARIDLEKENRYLNVEKLLVLNDIVRIKLDSNELDSAIYYLEADGSVEASCLLVPVAGKRRPVIAQQHVNLLRNVSTDPDVITNDPDLAADLDKFCAFNEFIIPIASRPGSYYSMTSQEWNTLQAYAASNSTIATYAESIKRWVGQTVVFDDAWPYLFDRMAVIPQEEELIIKSYDAELLISPNPGNGQYTIQGSILEPFSHGILYISDLTGRTLHSETISGSEFSRQIDISNYENGLYLCVLRLDGQMVATSHIVKQ